MKPSIITYNKVRLRTLLRRFGLPPNCTEQDVKSAYKEIAKQVHPDANLDSDSAAKIFTLLQSDYDELRELLIAYPMSSRRAADFTAGFDVHNSGAGQKYYAENPSEQLGWEFEQRLKWEEKHRDTLRNFNPKYTPGQYTAPEVPLATKVAVVCGTVGVFCYSMYAAAMFSAGRRCKSLPSTAELNKATQHSEVKNEEMPKEQAQKNVKPTKDPHYYETRVRKDTHSFGPDKIKRWEKKTGKEERPMTDREIALKRFKEKKAAGLLPSQNRPQRQHPHEQHASFKKDFKHFMEWHYGTRDEQGNTTAYGSSGPRRNVGRQDEPPDQSREDCPGSRPRAVILETVGIFAPKRETSYDDVLSIDEPASPKSPFEEPATPMWKLDPDDRNA